MVYNDKRMPVMDAICRHRGLCGEIARRIGSNRNAVWHWIRVPQKHAKIVADLTGLPVDLIKAEHRVPLEKWRISAEELKPMPVRAGAGPKTRANPLPSPLPQAIDKTTGTASNPFTDKLNHLRKVG